MVSTTPALHKETTQLVGSYTLRHQTEMARMHSILRSRDPLSRAPETGFTQDIELQIFRSPEQRTEGSAIFRLRDNGELD